jgi:sodium-dependent phosphate cotransporter
MRRTVIFGSGIARAVGLLLLLWAFLVGVYGFGEGLTLLGKGALDSFFRATENPFLALVVGILATSIVQSSSVTTSLIVGLTAAPENALPLANAIPMVMGANFGTTVTNSIVSLAHLGRRDEFRRAFAVATCDDFFEILSVCIILPLELSTGVLGRAAMAAAEVLQGVGGVRYGSPLQPILEGGLAPFAAALSHLFTKDAAMGAALAFVSAGLVLGSLLQIVAAMRGWMGSRTRNAVSLAFEQSALRGLIVGFVVTAIIQSSSITTSLLVPLGGAGIVTLEQAFPIVLGANIGTTLTALMAAFAVSGPNASAGMAIAIVHALYNLLGIAIFLPFRATRSLPLRCARWLARTASETPWKAALYILAIFYGGPAAVALLYHQLRSS